MEQGDLELYFCAMRDKLPLQILRPLLPLAREVHLLSIPAIVLTAPKFPAASAARLCRISIGNVAPIMPGMPLMPGVIMCEAAAQLASYYTQKYRLMKTSVVGFGGLKDVRFRGVVRPGERFVVVARLLKVRSSILTCEFQCFVRDNMVCEGVLMGIPLPEDLFRDEG